MNLVDLEEIFACCILKKYYGGNNIGRWTRHKVAECG